jgi:hypothetical protein
MSSLKEARSWKIEMNELLIDSEIEADAAQDIYDGARVGRLIEITNEGVPIVEVDGVTGRNIPARSIAPVSSDDRGRSALLLFERNDPSQPIIIGLLQQVRSGKREAPKELRVDGERVVIEAKREVSLRCGKSSITLCADGKIVIRGTRLLSRASGVNKIKGAAVEIN